MPTDTIRLNGLTFRRGFSAEVPPPSPDEAARLAESIDEFGILDPVDVREAAEPATFDTIDGWTRLTIAAEKGIECPYRVIRATDDAARKMALDLALARRQLTPERVSELRAKRVGRVAGKRAEGKSLRTIADEEKVSKAQIERDLEEAKSTVPGGGTVEAGKVKGKDGKVRPAKPKKPCKLKAGKPAAESNGENEPTPEPTPADLDAWGIPVQPHAAEAFAAVPKFKELLALLRKVRGDLTDLAESPGGVLLLRRCQFVRSENKHGGRWVLAELDNAIGVLEDATPRHTDCPYHFNPHHPHAADSQGRPCPLCFGKRVTGNLKKFQVPPDLLAAMREHYGVSGKEAG